QPPAGVGAADDAARAHRAAEDDVSKPVVTKPAFPPRRGWPGRGGGSWPRVEAATEWRGTSGQVCGLYPFSVGSPAPLVGTPLGPHLATGDAVCGDPISWFSKGLRSEEHTSELQSRFDIV